MDSTTRPDSKERLLDATMALLWQRGYSAMSPRDILKTAEVGQGSMYHHFPGGKRELAEAALRRNCDATAESAVAALDVPGTARDRLRRFINRPRSPLRGCKAGRMTQDPGVVADPALMAPVRDALDRIRDAVAAALRDGVRNGEFRADIDVDATATTILAIVQGAYVLAIADTTPSAYNRAMTGASALVESLRTAGTPGAAAAPTGSKASTT